MIHKETHESVAILRLEHGKVNILDPELLSDLKRELVSIRNGDSSSIVLTGNGACFSAGLNLFDILNKGEEYIRELMTILHELLLELFTFPRPVVAAVNGHAIAGGCVIACACDFRIMADANGKIGIPELLVGVPFPVLPLEIIRFAVPAPHFQQLVYTGRNCLPKEALEFGLIDEVAEQNNVVERACMMAEMLAAVPANAFYHTKKLMRQPVLDRLELYRDPFDPSAEEIWVSGGTRDVIKQYLERTVGK